MGTEIGTHRKDFRMPFGSHKGKTIDQIHRSDPQYVLWLRDETTGAAQKAAEEFIHGENKRICENAQHETT